MVASMECCSLQWIKDGRTTSHCLDAWKLFGFMQLWHTKVHLHRKIHKLTKTNAHRDVIIITTKLNRLTQTWTQDYRHKADILTQTWTQVYRHKADILTQTWTQVYRHKADILTQTWTQVCRHKADLLTQTWTQICRHKAHILTEAWARCSQSSRADSIWARISVHPIVLAHFAAVCSTRTKNKD